MKKKLMSFLLIYCIAIALLPVAVFAECGECGDNANWQFEDGVLTVSGTGAMNDFDQSGSVPWESVRSQIKTVIISDGITSISESAFSSCDALTDVELGNSLETIASYAFYDCNSIKSIYIPASVTQISDYAISDCYSLTDVKVDDLNSKYSSDDNGAIYNKEKTRIIMCPCGYIGKFIIPQSVRTVNSGAFSGCARITSISIPDSVTNIGGWAFEWCTKLTSIDIPSGVNSIGPCVCRACKSLKTANILDGVTEIPEETFNGCKSLESVSFPLSVKSIENHAFQDCNNLQTVNFSGTKELWDAISIGQGNKRF